MGDRLEHVIQLLLGASGEALHQVQRHAARDIVAYDLKLSEAADVLALRLGGVVAERVDVGQPRHVRGLERLKTEWIEPLCGGEQHVAHHVACPVADTERGLGKDRGPADPRGRTGDILGNQRLTVRFGRRTLVEELIADGVGDVLSHVQSGELVILRLLARGEQQLHPVGRGVAGEAKFNRLVGKVLQELFVSGVTGDVIQRAQIGLERVLHLAQQVAQREVQVLLGLEQVQILAQHNHAVQGLAGLGAAVEFKQVFVQLRHDLLGHLGVGQTQPVLLRVLEHLGLEHLIGGDAAQGTEVHRLPGLGVGEHRACLHGGGPCRGLEVAVGPGEIDIVGLAETDLHLVFVEHVAVLNDEVHHLAEAVGPHPILHGLLLDTEGGSHPPRGVIVEHALPLVAGGLHVLVELRLLPAEALGLELLVDGGPLIGGNHRRGGAEGRHDVLHRNPGGQRGVAHLREAAVELLHRVFDGLVRAALDVEDGLELGVGHVIKARAHRLPEPADLGVLAIDGEGKAGAVLLAGNLVVIQHVEERGSVAILPGGGALGIGQHPVVAETAEFAGGLADAGRCSVCERSG